MTGFIRRVVTGHDSNGRAVVLSEALTPTLKMNPLRPGHKSTEVWRTSATPAPISGAEPDPCRILFVLIDGEFDAGLSKSFQRG